MAKKKKDAWLEGIVQKSIDAGNSNYAQNIRQQVDSGQIAPIKTTVKKTTKTDTSSTNSNQLAPIKTTTNKTTSKVNADGYTDTGKTLGQYSKVDYENRKNWKVYSKDDKFYFYNERTKKYELITNNTNNEMKSADSIKSTKKDTKKVEDNKNQLAPIKNQSNIANNTFSEKAKGATNKVINKTDPLDQLNTENRLKLDTSGLEGQEYNQYAGQLLAEQNKNKSKYNKTGNILTDYILNLKERVPATATTTAYLLNKGLTKSVENIVDAGATAGAFITDKLGDNNTSKKLKNYIKEDRTSKVVDSLGNEMKLAKAENNTIVKRNNILGKAVEGIGGQIPNLALGMAGNLTKAGSVASKVLSGVNWGTVGLRGAGSGAEEALMSDANIDDATKYAILNGATEVATEWLTGGIPGVKGSSGGGIDKIVAKSLGEESIDQASKSLSHALIKAGYRMVGEGGEEALAEILNPFIKNATYSQGETIDWQQVGESAIIGAVVGGVLNAPVSIMDINNARANEKQTQNSETIINHLLENEEQNNINSQQNTNITQTTTEDTTTEEPTETTIETDITDLQNTIEHLQERKQSIADAQEKEQLNTQIAEMQEQLTKLQTTQEEQFNQMAEENNLDPNNQTLKNTYKLLNQRGVQIKIDPTPFTDTNTNAFWSIDGNGRRQIVINPNANTGDLVQNVAVHELTHDLLSSENSSYMLDPDDIRKYISTKEGYKEARQDLERIYVQRYGRNNPNLQRLIDEEAVASVLGNKLGTQEFVNELIGEKPTLAKQIYNWVMDKLDSLRKMAGYENEAMYWRNVKKRFEKAYNMSYNTKNKKASSRYATVDNNPYGHVEDFVMMSQKQQAEAHRVISPKASELATLGEEYGSATDINGNTYYFDVLEDGNYRVDRVSKHRDIVEEVANETDTNRDSRYSLESEKHGQRHSDRNTQSTRDNGTSRGVSKLYSTKSGQQRSNEERQTSKESSRNRELDNSSFSYDNKDKKLTKEQQEFFKDSKARDDKGRLEVVYHTTPNKFTVFDKSKLGTNTDYTNTAFGYFVTPNKKFSSRFGDINDESVKSNTMQLYINIEKPIIHPYNAGYKYDGVELDNIVREYLKATDNSPYIKELEKDAEEANTSLYDMYMDRTFGEDPFEYTEFDKETLEKKGYDSVIIVEGVENNVIEGSKNNNPVISYAVFNNNQIKDVDNTNPTNDPDIRYSENGTSWQAFVEKNFKPEGTGQTLQDIKVQTEKAVAPLKKEITNLTKEVNKLNKQIAPVKQKQGNIPIKEELLDKYSNAKDIFKNESTNYDGKVNIKRIDVNLENKNATDIYHDAVNIFKQNHNVNRFKNDGNNIYVTNQDIKESINKVYNDRLQNKYLKEHLQVFSDLGDIIESAKLVSQTFENKNRTKYNTWNYYFNNLDIDGEKFNLEFEVVSRQDGENHYRIQRLEKADAQSTLPIKGEVDLGASASVNNDTTKQQKSQIAPSINSMQQEEKNIASVNEKIQFTEGKVNKLMSQTATEPERVETEDGRLFDYNDIRYGITGDSESGYDLVHNDSGMYLKYYSTLKELKEDMPNIDKKMKQNKNNIDFAVERFNKVKKEQLKEKQTINAPISDNVKKVNFDKAIKDDSKDVAKTMNALIGNDDTLTIKGDWPDMKLRRWIETSTESDVVDKKLIIEDFDTLKATYEVKSNKKSLENANRKLNMLGYEKGVETFNNLLNDDRIPKAEDVILGERLLQEAINQNDIVTAKELIENIAIMGTELGQATQALSVIKRLTPEGQLKMISKTVRRAKMTGNKAFDDVEITPEMVEKILKTYNKNGTWNQEDLDEAVEQVKQDIADQLKVTTSDKINSWRYLSMLGNPKTHIRNIVSNIAMKGTISVKNAMARTIESVAPIKNRTKTWEKPSKTVEDFAKETTLDMKDAITGQNKYSEESSIERKKQVFKNAVLEKASKFNSKALEGEDWFFSKQAFENTFKEYLTAQEIRTQEDIENNPDVINKAKAYALEQAEISTFRQYSWLASKIAQIENKNAGTKLAVGALIPFKKTPINIAKAGVNYSPIGLIKSLSYDAYQVQQGNMEASQLIEICVRV